MLMQCPVDELWYNLLASRNPAGDSPCVNTPSPHVARRKLRTQVATITVIWCQKWDPFSSSILYDLMPPCWVFVLI